MTADGVAPASVVIHASDLDLAIFDLDGVVTRTARLHTEAWKQAFDGFLREVEGPDFRPFDPEADYLTHVDGKPRVEGVRAFLGSRGLTLPDGTSDDPPGAGTLWALGNAKNERFLALLRERGADTFPPAVALLRRLREAGFLTAVVSASRNCRAILESTHLTDLFDVRVDGELAAALGLPGKPAPDTFLEAARRLDVDPARAFVVEDAQAGVEAGRAGGFGLVIGVDRTGQREALLAHGADRVVETLAEVRVEPLPWAFDRIDDLARHLRAGRPGVFLDYDGTLTPIVSRPELAVLAESTREALRALAAHCTVAVVSGRDLDVIRDLVGLDEIVYAGDHGFLIDVGGGRTHEHEEAAACRPAIERVTRDVEKATAGVEGVLIERKSFSAAVHYRLVAAHEIERVRAALEEALAPHPELRRLDGKMVWEVQPRIDWHKGRAIEWLLEVLGVDAAAALYVGDDRTDEDAFRALRGRGTGVVVWEQPRPSAADYWLRDAGEVERLLGALPELVGGTA